ncbi:MAG: hypothetical protein NTW60_03550 [Candidatus Wolfebacteria bacterium]|nr:hypothetical protein [Candidatus Wolfebacteria bacterium]
MLKKLKSLSKSPKGSRLALILKAGALGTLFYLSFSGWLWLVLFFIASFFLYFGRVFNSKRFLASFLVILGAAAILFSRFSGGNAQYFWFSVFFGTLFFFLLGIKNLVFIPRRAYYFLLNSFLMGLCFLIFFSAGESWSFGMNYFFLGTAVYFLIKEFFVFNFESPIMRAQPNLFARKNLVALIFVFLLLQFVWGISFLPFGFLGVSALALLFVLSLEDLMLNYWNGILTRNAILRNITIFLGVLMVIFASSKWFL